MAAVALLAILVTPNVTDAAKARKHLSAPAIADPAQRADTGKPAATDPPTEAPGPPPANPKHADDGKSKADAANPKPGKWSDAEIADAKARCTAILQRIHAVAIAHEPIREGECGAPAPIELISIGENPEVTLSPPAIVRCDLADALATWLKNDLQPLALKHFKSPIIRIETMSSYSCRNAYGRKTTKLSEHGLANALDIGAFVTASAKTASVLEEWGTPDREIAEKAAAEKAAAEKAAAEKLAAAAAQSSTAPPVAAAGAAAAEGLSRKTLIEGMPKVAAAGSASASQPDRLGGPDAHDDKAASSKRRKPLLAITLSIPAKVDPEMRAFLHEAHESACQLFGTTLGPEANADHRNHFHVDMAPRQYKKICD